MSAPHPHQYRFPLGIALRDVITGFAGTAVGASSFLSSPDKYLLQPNAMDQRHLPKAQWFEASRLEHADVKASGGDRA
jgi:hypothetical protein